MQNRSIKNNWFPLVFFFLLFMVIGQTVDAKMYVWTDENGVKHFTDSPTFHQDKPPEFKELPTYKSKPAQEAASKGTDQESLEKKPLGQEGKAAEKGGADADEEEDEFNTKLNFKDQDIELFVTSWCKYCKKAMAFLDNRGVSYRSYDIEKDAKAYERMKKLTSSKGLPFAVINGKKVQGWSKKSYEAAINK